MFVSPCLYSICLINNRSDLSECTTRIINGDSLKDIARDNADAFVKFHRGFLELQRTLHAGAPRDPNVQPVVHWWFGPTGTGKSRSAFTEFPGAYVKMLNKWWDGYLGHTTVIMDDYRPSMCPFNQLLQILDRYPMKVEMKGSSMELSATTFIITCCQRPEVIWHGKTEEDVTQLIRRITNIKEFHRNGTTTILKDSAISYVQLTPQELSVHPYVIRDVTVTPTSAFLTSYNRI